MKPSLILLLLTASRLSAGSSEAVSSKIMPFPTPSSIKPPVAWHIKQSPTAPPKAPYTVTLTAAIDPGWHLYALQEPEGGPTPTEISLTEGDPADLLRVDQSKPRTLNDPLFAQPTQFFETTATFTLHLKPQPHPAANTLHIQLRYQSCNDHACLPPHTDTVEVPLH